MGVAVAVATTRLAMMAVRAVGDWMAPPQPLPALTVDVDACAVAVAAVLVVAAEGLGEPFPLAGIPPAVGPLRCAVPEC